MKTTIKYCLSISVWLAAMLAGTPVQAEEFTLRIGAGHPTPGLTYVYVADTHFVPEVTKRVQERTPHTVRFIKAWAGTVAKADNTVEAVQKGALDIGLNVVAFEQGRIPLLNFGYYFPFSPTNELISQRISMRMLKEVPALQESMKPYNAHILFISNSDRYGMITKFKLDRIEDIKGKRIACAGSNAPWVEVAGGVPVQLPITENYQGLQSGMIDGNIYIASGMVSFRFAEVAKYFTNTGFGSIAGAIGAFMNLDTRKRLPKEIVAIIDEVAEETSKKNGEIAKQRNDEAEEKARAAGTTVTTFSDAEKVRWATLLKDIPSRAAQEATAKGFPGTEVYKAFLRIAKEEGHKFPYEYQIQ